MTIGTSTQLSLYNGALRLCGNARLQTLTDNLRLNAGEQIYFGTLPGSWTWYGEVF